MILPHGSTRTGETHDYLSDVRIGLDNLTRELKLAIDRYPLH